MSLSTVTRLAPTARSASRARRIVEAAVAEAGLDQWLDEAVLLVTELVTNAVVHAGTELELHVQADASTLRIEVVDRMPAVLPLIQYSPADAREGGRGIFLLDALATEWGTRHFGAGKSIWFCLGPGLPVGPRRPPAAYDADAGARRDISWLVGLPADLEEQLSSSRLISELFRRLVEALGLERAWLFFESAEDDRRWEAFAASDALIAAPDAADVRRAVMSGSGRLLAPNPAGRLLALRGHSAVAGAMVLDCAGQTRRRADQCGTARRSRTGESAAQPRFARTTGRSERDVRRHSRRPTRCDTDEQPRRATIRGVVGGLDCLRSAAATHDRRARRRT
jgi:anti-sigma regulatory factor (Ser/Thr protein kinase)